jgi:hypothetical protein
MGDGHARNAHLSEGVLSGVLSFGPGCSVVKKEADECWVLLVVKVTGELDAR